MGPRSEGEVRREGPGGWPGTRAGGCQLSHCKQLAIERGPPASFMVAQKWRAESREFSAPFEGKNWSNLQFGLPPNRTPFHILILRLLCPIQFWRMPHYRALRPLGDLTAAGLRETALGGGGSTADRNWPREPSSARRPAGRRFELEFIYSACFTAPGATATKTSLPH